jgi:hypothetical protein
MVYSLSLKFPISGYLLDLQSRLKVLVDILDALMLRLLSGRDHQMSMSLNLMISLSFLEAEADFLQDLKRYLQFQLRLLALKNCLTFTVLV